MVTSTISSSKNVNILYWRSPVAADTNVISFIVGCSIRWEPFFVYVFVFKIGVPYTKSVKRADLCEKLTIISCRMPWTVWETSYTVALLCYCQLPTPLLCEFWFPEKRILVPSLVALPFPVHLISEICWISNL